MSYSSTVKGVLRVNGTVIQDFTVSVNSEMGGAVRGCGAVCQSAAAVMWGWEGIYAGMPRAGKGVPPPGLPPPCRGSLWWTSTTPPLS